jgi:hypothetical protein
MKFILLAHLCAALALPQDPPATTGIVSSSSQGNTTISGGGPDAENRGGFQQTCNWWHLTSFTPRYMCAQCPDSNGNPFVQVFDLGQCIKNNDGTLALKDPIGGFEQSCTGCSLTGSPPTVLSCAGCLHTDPRISTPSSIDLSTFISNESGRLDCYGIRGFAAPCPDHSFGANEYSEYSEI